MKCASDSWSDSGMSSLRSGMVISFPMPVLDNGTIFQGPIPYALHTRKHLCPEMHLTLILDTLYKTDLFVVLYDFMFDRIICVLVRI